ncbi:glycosyl transferase family 2 [Mesonia algae]|uniref:Glycosyl transferase family 2 n=1 Tax=Mesonia algae TaxID=213248 RepID=A0A2W7HWN1_9FLAO|nr:glycosyltransferase family 2 protein [Mesonia algae]PZW39066.1 glycosyl transferase family 2 [Mesonia algae]
MKVAVVMTVKNEERLLLQNIQYHLGIGIDCIFIYFDGTTDHGKEKVKEISKVIVQDSVQAEKYKDRDYLDRFTSNAQEHHTARQCLNTYDALEQSKAAGIDWLISLDADELFITNEKGYQSVEEFFTTYNENGVEQIHLEPLEIIARQEKYDNVMAEETLFKVKKSFKSKFDQIYHQIYNPYTKTHLTTSYWLGQTMGKAAIRVNSGLIPKNVHRYEHGVKNKKVVKINAGNVLHYHMYDFEDFIKKFKNFKDHPPVFLSGNAIENFKQLFIQLVNDPNFNQRELKKYYKENLFFDSKKLKDLKKTRFFNILSRKEKAFIEITKSKEVLKGFTHE